MPVLTYESFSFSRGRFFQNYNAPEQNGPVVGWLGDSMFDTGFSNIVPPNAGATKQFTNFAAPGWCRFLTNQRIMTSMSQNYAHSGDVLSQIAARVPAVIAARPNYVCVNGGTNDLAVTAPFTQMRDTFLNSILYPLVGAGMRIILTPITPRPNSGIPSGEYQAFMEYNAFLREVVRAQNSIGAAYAPNISQTTGIYIADVTPYWTDFTSSTGDPLANFLRDTVHASAQGAYWYGLTFANVLNALVPNISWVQHPEDVFVAPSASGVGNISGNALRSGTTNQGMLQGTGGVTTASSGFTFSVGAVTATGWTMRRVAGTSTAVCSASKENPRTDIVGQTTGERQLISIACSTSGASDEQYNFRFTSTFNLQTGDIKNGDTVWGEISLEITSHTNGTAVELALNEFGGALSQTSIDMARGTGSIILPTQAAAYPIVGRMRTDPITIQGDSTSLTFGVTAHLDASTVSNAAISIKLADAVLRKIGP